MSEGGGPRRSARIASKRQTTSGDESKSKRMKSDLRSRALTSAESFDERLRDVFSLRAAIPVLDEYLSSIQIDDDDPGFLLDWEVDNVNAFVDAVNGLNAAQAPPWLRTRPITARSFIDDLVYRLQPVAGGRCGRVLLAPNRPDQFAAIEGTLMALQMTISFKMPRGWRFRWTTTMSSDTSSQRITSPRQERSDSTRIISHHRFKTAKHCVGSSSDALSFVRVLSPLWVCR